MQLRTAACSPQNSDPSPANTCPRSRPRSLNHRTIAVDDGSNGVTRQKSHGSPRFPATGSHRSRKTDCCGDGRHLLPRTSRHERRAVQRMFATARIRLLPAGWLSAMERAKTPCAKCPTRCFQPIMRTRIKAVMRYAGPRMLFATPSWRCCTSGTILARRKRGSNNGQQANCGDRQGEVRRLRPLCAGMCGGGDSHCRRQGGVGRRCVLRWPRGMSWRVSSRGDHDYRTRGPAVRRIARRAWS